MEVLFVAEQLRAPVPGGIGTYTRALLSGLRQMRGEAPSVTVCASRPLGAGTGIPTSESGTGGKGVAADPVAASGFPLSLSRLPHRVLTAAWTAGYGGIGKGERTRSGGPRDAVKGTSGFDVVHAPSFAYPAPRSTPLVAVVNDLAWRAVPDAFTRHGRSWHDRRLSSILATAATVVVPSEETARELERVASDLGASAGHSARRHSPGRLPGIEVVTYGADHLGQPDLDTTDAFLDRLGVTGAYVLAVGTLEPRKNLRSLVGAFLRARPRLGGEWTLVVVGPDGWGEGPERGAGAGSAPSGVLFTGPVPGDLLAGLYARAGMAAYVPLLEGWGLPAVEAMVAGVPVLASRIPAVGDAALVVDAGDVGEIADGLVAVATDGPTRERLVAAGRARVAGMTWLAAARRHIDVWEAVA